MWFQGLGANLSGSDCCYMVVFQYGSIVLFNVRDHEVDGYLKIVERHASGLLPEMRKDGMPIFQCQTCAQPLSSDCDHILISIIGQFLITGSNLLLDALVKLASKPNRSYFQNEKKLLISISKVEFLSVAREVVK